MAIDIRRNDIPRSIAPFQMEHWFASQVMDVTRGDRDAALAAGHQEEANRLRGELDFLQAEADTAAIIAAMNAGEDLGAAVQRQIGEGDGANKPKFHAMGAFSADAVMGLFGGETQTDRMERLEQRQLAQQELTNQILARMAARPGLAF